MQILLTKFKERLPLPQQQPAMEYKRRFLWIVFTILLPGFYNSSAQVSPLRKLSTRERIEYARNRKFPSTGTVYKDSIGNTLKGFSLSNPVIDHEIYSGSDFFVNSAGKITEVVVRKASLKDKDLSKRLADIEEEQFRGALEVIKIDCKNQKDFLHAILKKDKQNRNGPIPPDASVDRENESAVTSLLQQCGAPTRDMVGDSAIKAIYLVLLHGTRVSQEKYFSVVKSYAEKGNLKKQYVATLEDKLLMSNGEKQKYGTQIVHVSKTVYSLFPIKDPDDVDSRRADVGLPPLEEYLRNLEEQNDIKIRR